MAKMKILIITQGFYPEQSPRAFRATELVKELCRKGHEVTVMAPYRKGTEGLAKEFGFSYKSLGVLTWRIFNLKKVGLLSSLYNKAINRLLPFLIEYPMMEVFFKVKKALVKEKVSYDLLISIAVPYPIHWGVASVWKKFNKNMTTTWIADCGDPYCLQENDTLQPLFYFRWVEKWFMRKTDYVTVPTENSFKGYFPEFHFKIHVIPQGFCFEDINRQLEKKDGIVRFGYGGVFISGRRDPKQFLVFLTSLPLEYKFEFHVFTSSLQLAEPYVGNDQRIILHNPISRLELLETFSAFQFVVNFANKGTAQTPSKLIDYAIIDKPILQIESGVLDESVVLDFLGGNYKHRHCIANTDQYRIEKVTDKFLDLHI
jgi:hypothetical protein